MKALFAPLLACWLLAGQDRSVPFVYDTIDFYKSVRIAHLDAAIIESGRVVWQNRKITVRAPEEPVIAERVPKALLDTPAPTPRRATIRQVLSNTADGTPGEEVLENREFFEALHVAGPFPNAVAFAKQEHGTLGWFSQDYAGERILWSHGPTVLLVRVPGKNLSLVASGNLKAARLEDGNILRSTIALLFLQDVVKLGSPGADNVIDEALNLLYMGQSEASATLAREALNRFPELESTPDVTLLYLFAQLGLPETEASATAVIKAHPSLPTAWFYYGDYLEKSKRYREAAACFEKITMHEPPWHHWTLGAAKKELTYLKTY